MNLGVDFQHLLSVARLASSRGDTHPATVMLASYRAEADLLVGNTFSVVDAGIAREKARLMAEVLARTPTSVDVLPNPSDDPPQAFAGAKPKHRDPLSYFPLNSAEVVAAREIRAIHEATIKALQPHAPEPDAIKVDSGRKDFDPWRFFSDGLAMARTTRYLPWIARNQKRLAVPSRFLTLVELTFMVLLENRSLRHIETGQELGNGRLSAPFRWALRDYWS